MRLLPVLPIVLLLGACWTPGPGEVDPTRYPWDQGNRVALAPLPPSPATDPRVDARGLVSWRPSRDPQLLPQPLPQPLPPGTYCVIAIEPQGKSGITVGGQAPALSACSAPTNSAPGH